MFFRNAYDGYADECSVDSGLECLDPSLAQQNFADDADINTIVGRFLRTGELPPENPLFSYGDFTGVVDYHTALNSVIAAQDAFMSLPAQLRIRFDNDPAQFLAFIEDAENYDEAVNLGLVQRREDESLTAPHIAGSESSSPPKGASSVRSSKKAVSVEAEGGETGGE